MLLLGAREPFGTLQQRPQLGIFRGFHRGAGRIPLRPDQVALLDPEDPHRFQVDQLVAAGAVQAGVTRSNQTVELGERRPLHGSRRGRKVRSGAEPRGEQERDEREAG